MGKFIWSDWGRILALTAGLWNLWGALWAVFYRKYCWDFIGGQLGPVGIIPPEFAAPFIELIVKIPAVQLVCIATGIMTIVFEWPVFPLSFLYRNLAFKAVFYSITGVIAGLLYQTVDGSVIYLLAIWAYVMAMSNGEVVGEKGSGTSFA